jgi:sugar/nucleoside kinase (ribokinase family)
LTPDLVVLGNLLVDDVVFEDGRTRMGEPGGAVLYAALGAWLWGIRVGVCSVLGDDYPPDLLRTLADRGLDFGGARRFGGPGLRTWLLYEGRRRQVVLRLDRPSHAQMSPGPTDIPTAWNGARAFHLAPMPANVQQSIVAAVSARRDALVSLDPYLLMRPDTVPIWQALLPLVDVFFVSEDEDEIGEATLQGLVGPRTRHLLWKRGARGGRLWDVSRERAIDWAARADVVRDTTGAGDALAGGFLAGLLLGDTAEEALERGVVSASFAIADVGAAGLLAATREDAASRREQWYGR